MNPVSEDNYTSIQYSSAGLLLKSAKDEYNKERERAKHLDKKAEHFMTLIVLVATVFIPIIPFNNLIGVFKGDYLLKKYVVFVICKYIIAAFSLLIYAFKNLYDSYKLQFFLRFDINNITDANLIEPLFFTEKTLCIIYRDIVNDNIKTNKYKADNVEEGILFCCIGFLVLMLSTITLKLLI